MKIDLRTLFGDELIDSEIIRENLSRIPALPNLDEETIVDFSGCVMEYDATGIITDYLLGMYLHQSAKPKITIIYDLDYPEDYLIDFLFSETKFLGSGTASLTNEKRKKLLTTKLRKVKGALTIKIVDPKTSAEVNNYSFGA